VNPRTLLSIANLVAIVAALFVLIEYPQYSSYAFYALLAWIFLSLALAFSRRSGPRPGSAPAGASPAGRGAAPGGDLSGTFASSAPVTSTPLPSAAPGGSRTPLDFCIYCGTTLPAGSTVCPACGHGISSL
jgi:hypothetical protein